ncbi:hypothetical protein CLV28_1601 [Sediminihabitans luteus]|uniref:Universal stress protein family protein n=1 Tax=Sediminihabitans luteus TaxID=1138585 RepID=A0A2M9CQA8_9CELL|nr:hypothetical protein [Sediminihabitans luteus]PJJ74112.1 hypothetical protein CLV28_1601 [Sediminihabitans luteus]GII97973.1 hypothetical protein Slu03_03510 [Sediminihabitans luteus]
MTDTILVLAEDALSASDVEHVTSLHTDDDVRYRVLVPADTEHNLVESFIDYLSLGYLREAWDAMIGKEPDPVVARQTAGEQLATTVQALADAGVDVVGEVTEDDPLPAVRAIVEAGEAREIVVLTYPHAVEDTFHTDWASKARESLQVPVLHIYLGTSELG